MNLEQVMALTEGELRIKAAELAGWEVYEAFPAGAKTVMYRDPQTGMGLFEPPDYPHDITAAWELFLLIPMPCGIERGYEIHYGVGPIGFHVGFGALPQNHDEDAVWAETVWNEEPSRAITMAFVLAMTQEETK